MIFSPKEIPTKDLHGYLLGSIGPRPICFASTIDKGGRPNLSPFSFFNVFGSNPATLIFSPARRVRDNTLKHTLHNAKATQEVVISVVNYAMVQQMSLSSCEYPDHVNEFEKAGFTQKKAALVKPFLVQESPVNFECKVVEIKETGTEGGAGNLIICEVMKVHINDEVLDEDGSINPHKIDLVARMGKDYYCRASGASVFEVSKPNRNLGIGFDQLPSDIKTSSILTGNELAALANVSSIPAKSSLSDELLVRLKSIEEAVCKSHHLAKQLIGEARIEDAWQVLLQD